MHNVEVWGGWGGLGGWGDYGIMHNVEMRWGLRRAGRLWECEDGHYGIMHNVEVWGKWVGKMWWRRVCGGEERLAYLQIC